VKGVIQAGSVSHLLSNGLVRLSVTRVTMRDANERHRPDWLTAEDQLDIELCDEPREALLPSVSRLGAGDTSTEYKVAWATLAGSPMTALRTNSG
jgi:hypothetical protein